MHGAIIKGGNILVGAEEHPHVHIELESKEAQYIERPAQQPPRHILKG